MNWNEIVHIGWGLLGLTFFVVDQWDAAVTKQQKAFSWKIFRKRNLPSIIKNFLAIIMLTGIAISTDVTLTVATSIGIGYGGSYIFKNRYKRNEGNPI